MAVGPVYEFQVPYWRVRHTDGNGRSLVASKLFEESMNTGTPPNGDDTRQQQAKCRSVESVVGEGAGRIRLLECPFCPGAHSPPPWLVEIMRGCQRTEEIIKGRLSRAFVDLRKRLAAR